VASPEKEVGNANVAASMFTAVVDCVKSGIAP